MSVVGDEVFHIERISALPNYIKITIRTKISLRLTHNSKELTTAKHKVLCIRGTVANGYHILLDFSMLGTGLGIYAMRSNISGYLSVTRFCKSNF